MFCKNCGSEINGQVQVCPQCGVNTDNNAKSKKKPIFKKWWFWVIIVIAVAIVFGGISGGNSDNNNGSADTTIEASNVASGEAGNSNEDNNTIAVGIWEKDFYVDDFNEPTDEWYVSSEFSGTFSNSATNDSRLSGYILIDAVDVSFVLYEYNSNQVKNIFSDAEEYTITARSKDGEQTFTGYIYSEGDRIIVKDSDVENIKGVLMNGGEIKFYIYKTDNSVTNYLFKVESSNLKDLLGE